MFTFHRLGILHQSAFISAVDILRTFMKFNSLLIQILLTWVYNIILMSMISLFVLCNLFKVVVRNVARFLVFASCGIS